MESLAFNFNPLANTDDGTCIAEQLGRLDKKIKTRNIIDESEFTNLISGIFRYE